MTKENSSIALFDSGVGGLSVWREIIKLLPGQQICYFADEAYAPYGPRAASEIIERGRVISEFLISKGAKIIVVACNTATAAAISTLRSQFNIPFIGMEPAIKPAAMLTKTGVVGVLATKGTFSGSLYNNTLNKYASNVKVIEQCGTGLVQLVESGKVIGKEVEELLYRYVSPMLSAGADYIVLGCTHYPFLSESIQKVSKNSVTLINPAPAVARHLYRVIKESGVIDIDERVLMGSDLYKKYPTATSFYSSAGTQALKRVARGVIDNIPESSFVGNILI